MRQRVVRADLGVPDGRWELEMSYDPEAHSELSKANLLRLRGDFAEAEKLCVSALEQHPESAGAHTLLGDIALAQDLAEQAVEHFEIALQLDPTVLDVPRKLEEARTLKAHREAASSIEQLGLPKTSVLPWSTIAFAGFSMLCLFGALYLGLRSPHNDRARVPDLPAIVATRDTIVHGPVEKVSPAPSTIPAVTKAEDGTKKGEIADSTSPVVPATGALEDRSMLQLVQGGVNGNRVQVATQDPRTKEVSITYSVVPGEDPRKVGAEIAKSTLDQSGDTQQITLRAVRDGRLIYIADVPRTRYADTLTDQWQHSNPDTDAWVSYSIVNEWPYRSTDLGENAPKSP